MLRYRKFSIKPPLFNKPSSLFRGRRLITKPALSLSAPSPPPYYSSRVNDKLYIKISITTVKPRVDLSWMVYSPDLFLILCCMISNFSYLSFSTPQSSSLWRTDTIVFAKLKSPPPPSRQMCLK